MALGSGRHSCVPNRAEDWPADQKFRVTFDKNFFPRHVLMERDSFMKRARRHFSRHQELEIYQDPTNATRRDISATLELTHAVDPGELERHVQPHDGRRFKTFFRLTTRHPHYHHELRITSSHRLHPQFANRAPERRGFS
jgi:hypothetical protein